MDSKVKYQRRLYEVRSLHPCHRNDNTNGNPWELLADGKFFGKMERKRIFFDFYHRKVSFYIIKTPTLFTNTVC
jgi:hypothetical protein